jgi:hypothetical protein
LWRAWAFFELRWRWKWRWAAGKAQVLLGVDAYGKGSEYNEADAESIHAVVPIRSLFLRRQMQRKLTGG